ncbi:MAG: inositol-3-phosphate synthase [Deltaproteobacteria bacterium]|nr:inositol-3-phosphate synthase [Deltaproteobacteria bacterium]
MAGIRVAIVGVGNCASALLQGIEFYRRNPSAAMGLMHAELGGYRTWDIQPVAAFDVDARKVGRPLEEAILARPNCIRPICPDLAPTGVTVQMGPVLDGVAAHMAHYPDERAFRVGEERPVDVVSVLRESGAEILVSYLPVGSEQASRSYAQACIEARVSLVNCMPAFIVSDPGWGERFRAAGIPCVGDDIKSQVGATIIHRVLAHLFAERGGRLDRTYQLNTGGNTDFLNMLEKSRLASKKVSKTEAVQSVLPEPLPPDQIHIGPSDYIPWQDDNKICFLRMEGRGFGGSPIELEARLSVQDSPNSGGVAVDAIRVCKVARDRGDAGPLLPISAYAMKHPPVQMDEPEARSAIEAYLAGPL